MISRFFKKTSKKTARVKKTASKPKIASKKMDGAQKLLTAEGWKRFMMRKKNSVKGK